MAFKQLYKNGEKVKKFEHKLSIISETMINIIKTLTWINRVFMIPFLISLLILIVDSSYFFYSMYIGFALGFFQLLSSLFVLFYHKKIKNYKSALIYVLSVVLYFFSVFLFFEFERYIPIKDLVFIILWIVPILLSLFWTYILESINKEI